MGYCITLLLAILLLGSSSQASLWAAAATSEQHSPTAADQAFEKKAAQLRESAIQLHQPPRVETKATFTPQGFNRYPWKKNILTTVFWIGETPTPNNPVPNSTSSWDGHWYQHFGGYDNPNPRARRNYITRNFIPKQNPFYCALPYNDITRGATKRDAYHLIPWFKDTFKKPGHTVLKGRWIAIHYNGKTCFAQWEDCGPFRTDHSSYVFGNERPLPNLNHGAGLDVSPAVRDYLGLGESTYCDWKFVEPSAVADGPWKLYGHNNTFWLQKHGKDLAIFDPNNAKGMQSQASSFFPKWSFSSSDQEPKASVTPTPSSTSTTGSHNSTRRSSATTTSHSLKARLSTHLAE